MKTKNLKIVSTIFIAILMLSIIPLFRVKADAHNAVSMWIEPNTITLDTATQSIGYTFDVTVYANSTAVNCAGWQFQMIYNKNYLEAIACVYTGTGGTRSNFFEVSGTTNLMALAPTIDGSYNASHNYVLHGEAWSPMVPNNPYANLTGSCSRVTFEVVGSPPKGGSIDDWIDIKTLCTPPSGKTYMLDTTSAEMLQKANVFNCHYVYTWSTPPYPYLGVSPTTQEFGMYDNVVGWLVDVDVYLYALDAAWYLVNATFNFNYDPTLVEVTDVIMNTADWDFAATFDNTTTSGVISFFVETTQNLYGAVKIADVQFRIIYQGTYPTVDTCDLTFTDSELWDHSIEIPTNAPLDGEIRIVGFISMPMPHLEVVPTSTVIGPDPSLGDTFSINVVMKQLHAGWELVAYNFRLTYDNTLLDVVSVTEGSFLSTTTSYGYAWLLTGHTIPAAAAPTWVSLDIMLLKVVAALPGTYTFTLAVPAGITTLVNGSAVTSFTAPAGTTWKKVEFRNYNLFPITGDFKITCKPTTYQVSLYATPANDTDPTHAALVPWIRNVAAPPYTWFFSGIESDGMYGPHIAVGGLVATDNGSWYIFPSGEGVLATITFEVIKQSYVDLSCAFDLFDIFMINKDSGDIPFEDPINGTYTILGFDLPGRVIDLYTQYPDGFNGKGPNEPSDMFWPQKEVILYTYVTYNFWPVQQKLVAYEIVDPNGHVWDKKTAITNADGIAQVSFRMPWPCDDPESLIGVWTVTATVDIACIVVTDTLEFHYDYLATISKVTTDALEYAHGDTVTITITVTSHAQQDYSILVTAAIVDELGYTVGFASAIIEIGGAVFCIPNEYEVELTIDIPKFAAAGLATIHVNVFDKEPSEGGIALCPEFTPLPEIFIQPY